VTGILGTLSRLENMVALLSTQPQPPSAKKTPQETWPLNGSHFTPEQRAAVSKIIGRGKAHREAVPDEAKACCRKEDDSSHRIDRLRVRRSRVRGCSSRKEIERHVQDRDGDLCALESCDIEDVNQPGGALLGLVSGGGFAAIQNSVRMSLHIEYIYI